MNKKKKEIPWTDVLTKEMARFIVGTSGFLYEECLNNASRESMNTIVAALFESEEFQLAITSYGKITLTCHGDEIVGIPGIFLTKLILGEFLYCISDFHFKKLACINEQRTVEVQKEDLKDFAECGFAWWSRCLPELKKVVSLVEKQIKFYQKKIEENS